jgi:hypothetical protein
MNKGGKCILVKNNVVQLVLGRIVITGNTHKKSKNRVFFEPCHATSAEEWLPHGIHGPHHVIDPREESSDKSDEDMWIAQG